jgi:hypothetical protein
VSDIEHRLVCEACGKRGADVRPDLIQVGAKSQVFGLRAQDLCPSISLGVKCVRPNRNLTGDPFEVRDGPDCGRGSKRVLLRNSARLHFQRVRAFHIF